MRGRRIRPLGAPLAATPAPAAAMPPPGGRTQYAMWEDPEPYYPVHYNPVRGAAAGSKAAACPGEASKEVHEAAPSVPLCPVLGGREGSRCHIPAAAVCGRLALRPAAPDTTPDRLSRCSSRGSSRAQRPRQSRRPLLRTARSAMSTSPTTVSSTARCGGAWGEGGDERGAPRRPQLFG